MEVVRGSHVDTHQWLMPCHAWPTRLKMSLFYKPKSEAYCLPALIHTPALAIITTTLTASAHLWTPPPPGCCTSWEETHGQIPHSRAAAAAPCKLLLLVRPCRLLMLHKTGWTVHLSSPLWSPPPLLLLSLNLPASAHPPAAAPAKGTPMAHRASCSLVGAGAAAQRAAAALHKARWASCLPVQHTR